MTARTARAVPFLAVLALALTVVAPVSGADSAHYTDPTGDASGAPDITAIDVASTDSGLYTFQVRTDRRILPSGEDVSVWINSDHNTATGGFGASGIDYAFVAAPGLPGTFEAARWVGTEFNPFFPRSLRGTLASFLVTWQLNGAEFGLSGPFSFFVLASGLGVDNTALFQFPQPPPPPPVEPPPPAPVVRCVVPRVNGKTLTVARRLIVRARCSTGRVTRRYSAQVARGRVMRQSPRAGTRLRRGAKVNLVVSRGRR
jgi:hypothetical protein